MGLKEPANFKAITSISIGGFSLDSPCFFPSISSVKANLTTLDYLQVLGAIDYPQFLISAYDIAHSPPSQRSEIDELLLQRIDSSIVLLDSGNYEKYWLNNPDWTQDRFLAVLEKTACQISFCFDNQSPPDSVSASIEEVTAALNDADGVSAKTTVLPIVHGPVDKLSDVVLGVAEQSQPIILAVPERILGDGILARAKKVYELREILDTINPGNIALHLLGTGNPLSILVYSLCGANSFDGLEWCQTAVEPSTGRLLHFQQRDLVESVPELAHFEELDYSLATLIHNLYFYKTWMSMISETSRNGLWPEVFGEYLPESFIRRFKQEVREISIHGF